MLATWNLKFPTVSKHAWYSLGKWQNKQRLAYHYIFLLFYILFLVVKVERDLGDAMLTFALIHTSFVSLILSVKKCKIYSSSIYVNLHTFNWLHFSSLRSNYYFIVLFLQKSKVRFFGAPNFHVIHRFWAQSNWLHYHGSMQKYCLKECTFCTFKMTCMHNDFTT